MIYRVEIPAWVAFDVKADSESEAADKAKEFRRDSMYEGFDVPEHSDYRMRWYADGDAEPEVIDSWEEIDAANS